jgi:hypothetical protein
MDTSQMSMWPRRPGASAGVASSSDFHCCAGGELRKNGLVIEFSLCLSRAYLGEKIAFMYKWLRKFAFAPAVGLL